MHLFLLLLKDNNGRLHPCGSHFVHINGKVNHNGSQVPLTLHI
jgi:hypothetical protein